MTLFRDLLIERKRRRYYCEVEYLEFTGTQGINTGIIGNLNTSYEIIAKSTITGSSVTAVLFGSRSSATSDNISTLCPSETTNVINDFGSYTATRQTYTPTSMSSKLKFYNSKSKRSVTNLDTGAYNESTTAYSTSFTTPGNLHIGLKTSGYAAVMVSFVGYVYSCKIWDNGVLVRDFIPVLDWNMDPCMYDKVSGSLFYNLGTGTFSYGREIHYVEYLESDGTQYIDTGVYLTNNHSVELDYQLTSASQNRKGIFGGLVSNGARYGTLLSPSNNYLEFGYGSTNVWYQSGLPDTKRHVMKQEKNLLYFDGALIHTFNSATFTQNFTAPLGNFAYTNYTPASAKYYSSKWWDGNTLVRYYKPAIDENGVPFMFDKVTHTCFLNAGTGVFKYPARETEYIEVTDLGTNNQNPCLDLGLKYKPSISIESKYTRTAMGVSGSVLPLSNSTTQPLIYMPALNASAKTDRFVWRRPSLPEASYYYEFPSYPMTVEFKVDAVNDALTVNGSVVKTGMIAAMNGYTSPYQSDSNLYMLSINGTYGGIGKVYYLKLYNTTQVYRDLIPVWQDGMAGMYDKEHNVFYSNYLTGTVTCGKIIEPYYE